MNTLRMIALVFVTLQAGDPKEVCELPEVRNQLEERVQEDQKIRREFIEATREVKDGKVVIPTELASKMTKTDQANTAWLKSVVEKHGWLGRSLVGVKGAHNAWLLIQHADKDLAFQKKCLQLMTKLPKGEVAPVDIAYLTDRTLVAEGKLQRYGTQCSRENGEATMNPVEDPDNLNNRRKALGLEPIEEYLEFVNQTYSSKTAR